MAAEPSSVGTVDDEDAVVVFATPEEVWEMFDADARTLCGMSGDAFLDRVKAGEIVNDDSDSSVTLLFAMIPFLPADKRPH